MPNKNIKTIDTDHLVEYLQTTLKRYAGYFFISISRLPALDKTFNRYMGAVRVHQTLPTMDNNGLYVSVADIEVTLIALSQDTFPGMIMDREGKATLGNPFQVELDNPALNEALEAAFKPKQVIVDLSKKA